MRNQRKQASQFTEYTADRTVTLRDRNWRDVMTEEVRVLEHYQSWNRNLDVILSVDGKARSAKDIQEDREEAGRFMEIDMKGKPDASEVEGPEYGSRKGNFFMSTFQIYRHENFGNPRTELLDGRPMIVLDFAPRAGGEPTPAQPLKPVERLCGTVWIDAVDRVTVKLIAGLAPAFQGNAASREPVFVQTYVRTPEGIWMGNYTRLNPSVQPEFFEGETYDWVIQTRNYRRFEIDPSVVNRLDRKKP